MKKSINAFQNSPELVLNPKAQMQIKGGSSDLDNLLLATGNSTPNLFVDNVTVLPPFLSGPTP